MKNIIKNIFAVALLATAFVSCDGLDELPDNRTLMDSPEKVVKLMTSAYPYGSHATMCEFSSDNILDNNVVVKNCHSAGYSVWIDELYKWVDVKNYSPGSDDTPYFVWESYYHGIAVCNHAIEAMQQMSDDPKTDPALSATWAEAHILRAYMHFILVNLFAESYKNETLSMEDRGIPYVTVPEDVVHVDYAHNSSTRSVKETYDMIEKDLKVAVDMNENGEIITNISDNTYPASVRAFHFNKNAAYAFAARFYLFKRDYKKCIAFADRALGSNPASMLRKWSQFNINTAYTKRDSYWDEKANNNFLIQSTYSLQWRYLISSSRYGLNNGKDIAIVQGRDSIKYKVPSPLKVTLYGGGGPNWSGTLPCYDGLIYVGGGDQKYGLYHSHLIEYFEYSDKIAGIGYVHMLYNMFTAEETLLCRAEAKLYEGDKTGALSDLGYWTDSKSSSTKTMKALTAKSINDFYSRREGFNEFVNDMHPAEMGFEKVLTASDEVAMLDCILHFRRIETLHNGDRWFDIKRYGIKIRHFWRDPMEDEIHVDSLEWNDSRRVLQLPDYVIQAGFEPNRGGSSAMGGGGGGAYQISTKAPYRGKITPVKE